MNISLTKKGLLFKQIHQSTLACTLTSLTLIGNALLFVFTASTSFGVDVEHQ